MKVIFNQYAKIIFSYFHYRPGPGPGPGKLGPGPARSPQNYYLPARARPGRPDLQVSGPHPARPANYYRNLTRPGPWAAGRPGPRAEARPVQDTNRCQHQRTKRRDEAVKKREKRESTPVRNEMPSKASFSTSPELPSLPIWQEISRFLMKL